MHSALWDMLRQLKLSEEAILYSGGGGGYSTNIYTGSLRPEVQPRTLLCTIFHEKGIPFVYLLLTNGTPFIYLV